MEKPTNPSLNEGQEQAEAREGNPGASINKVFQDKIVTSILCVEGSR